MLDELLAMTDALDFEEYGHVTLESVAWHDSTVITQIAVVYQDEYIGRWRIACPNARNARIGRIRRGHKPQLLTDHVLLWPHTRPAMQLYYSGRIASPAAAMGDIWEAHRQLVGSWFPLDYFLTRLPPHLKYLDGGYGMFAQGPVDLMEAYARTLRQHGFATSLLPTVGPVWWDGSKWIPETDPLYLLLLEDAFIIAPQFTAEKTNQGE